MSDGRLALTDPRLLMEAARVFNVRRSGYRNAAASVAEQALAALKVARKTTPEAVESEVEQAIIGDCAALRLADRVDGGYREALVLLDQQIDKRQRNGVVDERRNDINGRLHLLRAFARGQRYKDLRNNEKKPVDGDEAKNLRQQIHNDLNFAFTQNPKLWAINRPFWEPGRLPAEQADLIQAFEEDPELKQAMGTDPAATRQSENGTAAQALTQKGERGIPSMRLIKPNPLTRQANPQPITIEGENLDIVKSVRISPPQGNAVDATNIHSTVTAISCDVLIGLNAPAGDWDVLLFDAVGADGNATNFPKKLQVI